jgi:hypothetical protein
VSLERRRSKKKLASRSNLPKNLSKRKKKKGKKKKEEEKEIVEYGFTELVSDLLEQHERDISGEQRSYAIGTLLFWQTVLNIVGKAAYEKLRRLDIFPMPCSKTCKLRMTCEGDNMEEFTPAIFLKVGLLFFFLVLVLVLSSITKSPSIFYSFLFSACKSAFECTT